MVSPGHAYTWASPRAPGILWDSLFRDDVALRLKLRADPRMWAWCWRFLKECSAERAAINPGHKVRLCLSPQQRFEERHRPGVADRDRPTDQAPALGGPSPPCRSGARPPAPRPREHPGGGPQPPRGHDPWG